MAGQAAGNIKPKPLDFMIRSILETNPHLCDDPGALSVTISRQFLREVEGHAFELSSPDGKNVFGPVWVPTHTAVWPHGEYTGPLSDLPVAA